MQKVFLEQKFKDLERSLPDVEILSREFIFDRKHCQSRNIRVPDNKTPHSKRTLLSLLLHEEMDDEHRLKIFPGKFDLGNKISIPARDCTYACLYKELKTVSNNYDSIDHVKVGIENLTGRKMSDFSEIDKSITLKVIQTLYSFKSHRSSRIFSALSAPEGGMSGLEFRDSYPHDKAADLVYLISDLHEYLGAELSADEIIQIKDVFRQLQDFVGKSDWQIQSHFVGDHKPKLKTLCTAYDQLIESITSYQVLRPEKSTQRLDKTLYTYIASLEFRHFCEQHPKLVTIGSSIRDVDSIGNRLVQIEKTAHLFPTEDVPEFISQNIDVLKNLVHQSLKIELESKALIKYKTLTENLLYRTNLFHSSTDPYADSMFVSVTDVVAGICAIHAEYLNRTTHKPDWHGQSAIGGSLIKSLMSNFNDEEVFEEHSQIWQIRLQSYKRALLGQSQWYSKRLEVGAVILQKMSEIAQFQNIAEISDAFHSFKDHFLSSCEIIERQLRE